MNTIFSLKLVIAYLIICLLSAWILFFNTNQTFYVNQKFNEGPLTIKVDGIPCIIQNKDIIPITATTLRAVSLSVGDQIKKVKFKKLDKNYYLQIKVRFLDKTVYYRLLSLPPFFPNYDIENFYGIKGNVLISFHGFALKDPSYGLITDMDGHILYYRGNPTVNYSVFHLHKVNLKNGKTRFILHVQDDPGITASWIRGYHLIMDENFNEIDRVSLKATEKHGPLLADEHDIAMLDDGHYIVSGQNIKYEKKEDGSEIEIVHSVIQEQKDGKVVLDWNSEDFPELQNNCYEKCPSMTNKNADYIHINTLEIDPLDNNLFVSAASGYYVMKLNRTTGKIMWILGGKMNEFSIPEDAKMIRQHDVQRLSDRSLALFDNHYSFYNLDDPNHYYNGHKNAPARILLLQLDESNKKVIHYSEIPLNFWATCMGSVQKLFERIEGKGNWFIGCGDSSQCSAKMIDEKGKTIWNIKAHNPYKMYRAYYFKDLK